MPKLHDKTRRRICLATFFVICIAPTLGFVAWGVSRQTPFHVAAHAAWLSQRLALRATIAAVEHPRPGVLRYKGVHIADPETGKTIALCRNVEAQRQRLNDSRQPALVLTVDRAEAWADRSDDLWQLLHRAMARRMSGDDLDVRLMADRLVLRSGKSDSGDHPSDESVTMTLEDVQVSLQTGDEGSQAELRLRFAEMNPQDAEQTDNATKTDQNAGADESSRQAPEPLAVFIRRDRTSRPPGLHFEVDARSTAIPCRLLGLLIGEAEAFESEGRFQGYLSADRSADSWQGSIAAASLSGVDLGRLCQRRFPDTLSGRATLSIEQANFADGRLLRASGSAKSGPGTIDRDFFDNLWQQLRLRPIVLPADAPDRLPYEILSFNFDIGSDGVQIHGTVVGKPAADPSVSIMLADAAGPMLSEPVSQPLSVAALLHALVPESQGRMPASRRSEWLSQRLPWPQQAEKPQTR